MKSRSVKVPVDPVLVFAAVYTLKALEPRQIQPVLLVMKTRTCFGAVTELCILQLIHIFVELLLHEYSIEFTFNQIAFLFDYTSLFNKHKPQSVALYVISL